MPYLNPMKKKYTIPFMLVLAISFLLNTSCSKDEKGDDQIQITEDKPGEIPGLGEAEGELTGQKYKLPEGIEQVGEIIGYEGDINTTAKQKSRELRASGKNNAKKAESPAEVSTDFSRGSGYYVRVRINLKNTTSSNRKVELPAGLVIKSRSGTYQNGVLLKKTSIDIPANKTILLDLHMYCGNAAKSSSSPSEKYDLAVISNSSSLHDLINRLKNKKINIEQYFKETDGMDKYEDIVAFLQNILWNVTDSESGLLDDDIEYINSIPND